MFQNIASKIKTGFAIATATVTSVIASALTVTNGSVNFDTADNTIMNQAVSNSIGNLWNGFMFVLPYVGIAVGVILVIALAKRLIKGR